eukprot:516703-Pelagomonas_calceolata.AAC.3
MEKIMAVQFWGNLLVWFLLSTRDGIESPEKWQLSRNGGEIKKVLKTLPQIKKRKDEGPRAEAFPPPREKGKKRPMEIRRVTSSTPCLILIMRVERSLFKSAAGARKLTNVPDRTRIKLQSKLGGFMSVKTEIFKGLKM